MRETGWKGGCQETEVFEVNFRASYAKSLLGVPKLVVEIRVHASLHEGLPQSESTVDNRRKQRPPALSWKQQLPSGYSGSIVTNPEGAGVLQSLQTFSYLN